MEALRCYYWGDCDRLPILPDIDTLLLLVNRLSCTPILSVRTMLRRKGELGVRLPSRSLLIQAHYWIKQEAGGATAGAVAWVRSRVREVESSLMEGTELGAGTVSNPRLVYGVTVVLAQDKLSTGLYGISQNPVVARALLAPDSIKVYVIRPRKLQTDISFNFLPLGPASLWCFRLAPE